MQPRESLGHVEKHEGVVEGGEGSQGVCSFVASQRDDPTRSARRQRRLGLLQWHQGDCAFDGGGGERGGGHDGQDGHIHQPLQRLTGHRVVGGHAVADQERVRSGDVLEGQADDCLARHGLVEGIGIGQVRGGHNRQHRTVAIEQSAVVESVAVALLRKIAPPPRKRRDVAAVAVRRNRALSRRLLPGRAACTNLGEAVARCVLLLGVLGKRHSDGVAQAVGKQGADTDGRFHAAVLALARLGDTQVEGVIPTEAVLLSSEEAVGLHHHEGVGRFHREDKVVVVERAADVGELDGRFDHAARRVAVKREYARGERAVVGTDAHRAVELLALLHERRERLDEELALCDEVVLRLVQLLLERLAAVDKVARVDSNLLDGVGDGEGDLRLEVHVGAQRDRVALRVQPLPDLLARLRVLHADDRDAHEIKPLVGAPDDLLDRALDVRGERGRHRLPHDRVLRAEVDRPALHRARLPPCHLVQVGAILAKRAKLQIARRLALLAARRRRPDVGSDRRGRPRDCVRPHRLRRRANEPGARAAHEKRSDGRHS
mmetsp:Transcript_64549/g.172127  ORF Transcript_64549/g.172127 Transcript_64549/m.172127 type:complete len:546 (-) Transcript_64549:20-1657(-)